MRVQNKYYVMSTDERFAIYRDEDQGLPRDAIHNSSGVITFTSAESVQRVIGGAELRKIKNKPCYVIFSKVGQNRVL